LITLTTWKLGTLDRFFFVWTPPKKKDPFGSTSMLTREGAVKRGSASQLGTNFM
jgi:hypothetical protein